MEEGPETYTLLDILKEIDMTPIIPTFIVIPLSIIPALTALIQPTKPLIPLFFRRQYPSPLPLFLGFRFPPSGL